MKLLLWLSGGIDLSKNKTLVGINPDCKEMIELTAEKIRNMLDVGTCKCEKVGCMINKE